jgi:hypothetical protein
MNNLQKMAVPKWHKNEPIFLKEQNVKCKVRGRRFRVIERKWKTGINWRKKNIALAFRRTKNDDERQATCAPMELLTATERLESRVARTKFSFEFGVIPRHARRSLFSENWK